jgi:hypothetical protein
MTNRDIIKSIFAAVALLAAGISPERSEHCEAMSLEGCAWVATETVGGHSAEIMV